MVSWSICQVRPLRARAYFYVRQNLFLPNVFLFAACPGYCHVALLRQLFVMSFGFLEQGCRPGRKSLRPFRFSLLKPFSFTVSWLKAFFKPADAKLACAFASVSSISLGLVDTRSLALFALPRASSRSSREAFGGLASSTASCPFFLLFPRPLLPSLPKAFPLPFALLLPFPFPRADSWGAVSCLR